MLVGEQPGDVEDLAGRPFVGPAGQLLDRALADAGIIRAQAYVTNAVKHFKHEPRGKRRLHKTPDAGEITACRWWLGQELAQVSPRVVVALGATAARGVLGELREYVDIDPGMVALEYSAACRWNLRVAWYCPTGILCDCVGLRAGAEGFSSSILSGSSGGGTPASDVGGTRYGDWI